MHPELILPSLLVNVVSIVLTQLCPLRFANRLARKLIVKVVGNIERSNDRTLRRRLALVRIILRAVGVEVVEGATRISYVQQCVVGLMDSFDSITAGVNVLVFSPLTRKRKYL
jgi:hypothetical protein